MHTQIYRTAKHTEKKKKVSSSPLEAGTLRQLLWMAEKQWSTFRPPVKRRCQAAGAWRCCPPVVAGRGGMEEKNVCLWDCDRKCTVGLWWWHSGEVLYVYECRTSFVELQMHIHVFGCDCDLICECWGSNRGSLCNSALESGIIAFNEHFNPRHSISRNEYRF